MPPVANQFLPSQTTCRVEIPDGPQAERFAIPGEPALDVPSVVRCGLSVVLRFGLPLTGEASVSILNVAGRRVAMAANGQWAPGYHSVALCPRNCGMVPGTYFAVLAAGRTRRTPKLVVTP